MRNPHAGSPFTAAEFSDDQIAEALQDVSIPTLLLSCVHMTDDPAVREQILTGAVRPQGLFLNEVQGYMSEEDQQAARTSPCRSSRPGGTAGVPSRTRSTRSCSSG